MTISKKKATTILRMVTLVHGGGMASDDDLILADDILTAMPDLVKTKIGKAAARILLEVTLYTSAGILNTKCLTRIEQARQAK